jgi:hypothetical protein
MRFKNSVTSLLNYGGAPSYWNSMSSGPFSSKIGSGNSSDMPRKTMPVTVRSVRKQAPNAFCSEKAHNTFNF